MKLSLLTTLVLCWLYGTIAGLVLPHGPLVLAGYGLVIVGCAVIVQAGQKALTYQLAMADFRRDLRIARAQARRLYAQQRRSER